MKLIRINTVLDRVGISKAHLYRLQRQSDFPKSVRIGSHSVGWLESEVEAWINERALQRFDRNVTSRQEAV